MKHHIHYLPTLLLCGLGLIFSGSGCATWNEFCGDFGAAPGHHQAATGGNWLDNLLPEEAPGTCPNCRPGMGPSEGGSGIGMSMFGGLHGEKAPPPQFAQARLHPVPTRPVFGPIPPEGTLVGANKRPANEAIKPADAVRPAVPVLSERNGNKTAATLPRRDNRAKLEPPSDGLTSRAKANTSSRKDGLNSDEISIPSGTSKMIAPSQSEVQATSGTKGIAPTHSPSASLPPLKFNAPTSAEAIETATTETRSDNKWHAVVPGGANWR